MKRLTKNYPEHAAVLCENCDKECKSCGASDCLRVVAKRLADIEDILGDTYDLDRMRELIAADRAGRCVPVTKDLLIAILAGLYALNTNKKMRGGMYVFDVHKEHGGPHTMEFSRAAQILAETAERVLDSSDDVLMEKEDGHE